MADLDYLYGKFNDSITLTNSKRDILISGRDAIRDLIKVSFSDEGRKKPTFCMQGSFKLKTVINPLGENEYDLDDGVYLDEYSEKDKDNWPETTVVKNWIVEATKNHTKTDPEIKTSCVRIKYAAGYHIDLPCYINKDDVCYLASKNDWVESNPKAFNDWFIEKINSPYYGEQYRRTVKYVKAWRDFNAVDLPSIAITILVANSFSCVAGRDDVAVKNTIDGILNALDLSFSCLKPVDPKEETLTGYTKNGKDEVLSALRQFRGKMDEALASTDEEEASQKMIEVFGDRFPKGKKTNDSIGSRYLKTSKPGVIGNDGRSS